MSKPYKRTPRLDLNPSSADRWTTCTASPAFIMENWDKLPPHDTKFNMEGTTAHEVAAALLQDRPPNLAECPTPIDGDMHGHAWDYWEYIQGLRGKGIPLHIEKKFPLWYMPERNAKVDVAILNPHHLHIVDYKYGEGVIVSPVNNLQGAIYARCVVEALIVKVIRPEHKITIHIVQPRGRENEGGVSVWDTTWGEIYDFTDERVTQPATFIQWVKPGQTPAGFKFAPSPKACQWCPAKGFCGARLATLTKDIETLAVIDEKPKHFPPAKALSVAQLCAILKHKDDIEKFLKDAAAYALEHLRGGGTLPGYKLVLSRGGNRYWTNPKLAKAKLLKDTILREEEIVEQSLISPKQVEDKIGKQGFTADLLSLIGKPTGVPIVAPEEDKRPNCLPPSPASEFDILD